MSKMVLALIVALVLSACNNFPSHDKYQLATSTDGNVYRLDKSSGEVWLIRTDSMEKVQGKDFRLKISHRYVGEDGYSFTYLGKGQVGEIRTLDDFWKEGKK